MNYIAEIKAFYDRLELNPQPNTVIALWHALMSIANKAGWPDTFTAAQSVLMLKSGLSASALKRARNKLSMDGFIQWKSRGGNLAAQYRMISLVAHNGLQIEPQTEPQCEPQTEPQCEPQIGPINKLKQKQNNIPPISPIKRLEEFFSAYPKTCGHRYLTETAYIDLLLTRKVTEDELVMCAQNYAEWCRILGKPDIYIKNAENFLKEFVFEKYLPGKYMKPERVSSAGFNDFMHQDYDFEQLEKDILSN